MKNGSRASLPELLFAVAGLSLTLLALGAGLLVRRVDDDRDLASRLHVLLQAARLEAVTRGTICRLEIDPQARHASVWDTRGTRRTGDDLLVRMAALPAEPRLSWIGAGSPPDPRRRFDVRFNAQGHLLDEPGEILVLGDSDERGAVTIAVEAGGEFRVYPGAS